jgi:hypothetical protein
MTQEKNKSLKNKSAYKYFQRLSENKQLPEDEFHIINEHERAAIKKVKQMAMLTAGLTGAFAVAIYYVPLYIFPEFFKQFNQLISLFGFSLEINLVTISFSLILIFLEIFILTRINIRAVAETANACGFPDKRDPLYDIHLEQLFSVGLETKNKETLKFGIDPYAGVPKFYILLFTVWNLVKATLTNFFVKMIVVKIFARAELRAYADLIGIPVFAIWNAVASWRIIEAAKVYIMAPGLIHQLAKEVEYLKDDIYFKQNIFDAMQYVVSVKRSFHHNHYLLVVKLIEVFDLTNFKDTEPNPTLFLQKIKESDENIKKAYSKLIVMGMFIDGSISMKDQRVLQKLFDEKIININPIRVKVWCKQFRNGEGLDTFIKN